MNRVTWFPEREAKGEKNSHTYRTLSKFRDIMTVHYVINIIVTSRQVEQFRCHVAL